MANVFKWIVRGMSTLTRSGQPEETDHHAEFECVDGDRLDASDFRASASMRLEPATHSAIDFSETLPACSFRFAELSPLMPHRQAA